MARTHAEIKKEMTDNWMAKPEIIAKYNLQPSETFEQRFSSVSLENTWFDVVAFGGYTLEILFDVFRAETDNKIAQSKVHTPRWYKGKALDYQHGYELVPETDYYDNTGVSDENIAASKIIANAAPVRVGNGNVRMKVVKNSADGYDPVDDDVLTGVNSYFERVTDAGTTVTCTTGPADMLKIVAVVYYDPLILNTQGARLDGTDSTPLQNGIKAHLKSIKFNGALILKRLTDDVEAIQGIKIFQVTEAFSKYGTYAYATTDVPNVGLIHQIRIADAGHMRLDESVLAINWIPLDNEYL